MGEDVTLTKRLWFQVGIGILLSLIILKYFMEIKWIFAPIGIITKSIFIPLLIGGVLFYISLPIQILLEKYKVPRWGSIIIIFLLLIGLLWAAIIVVGPPVGKQINNLVENAPAIAEAVNDFVIDISGKIQPEYLPHWLDLEDTVTNATEWFKKFSLGFGNLLVQFFQSLVQGAIILILAPFFLFFMLKDHDKFIPFIKQFFSGDMKKWIEKTLNDIDNVLSLYIRGQVLVSVILAILLLIGYSIIGLKFALLLSVFALFMNIIPFIGPWIAFIPALLIGLFQDPSLVIWESLVTLIAQQIDANLITPNVMGKTLKIHPLSIITGFIGILLEVTAYAVGKTIVGNIYEKRQDNKKSATKTV